jgi:hypothetical protein
MSFFDDHLAFTAGLAPTADRFQLHAQLPGSLEQVAASGNLSLSAGWHQDELAGGRFRSMVIRHRQIVTDGLEVCLIRSSAILSSLIKVPLAAPFPAFTS